MTKDEAMKLALEALEEHHYGVAQIIIREALAQPDPYKQGYADAMNWKVQNHLEHLPVAQKIAEWKLVPINPTNEMLKAMDECSTEGYDERLLAGHAASVYMAAVDVAPTPPQPKDQEPVVLETVYETIIQWDEGGGKRSRRELARRIVDLYTTPPQRKPLTDEHVTDGSKCWCDPELDYKDPDTGAEVWIHRGKQ